MPLGDNNSYNQKALQVYRDALPGYEVIGIEGYESGHYSEFLNTDALHCRTHEVPDDDMLFIDSREVLNGEVEKVDKYLVKTNVVSYSDSTVSEDNVYLYYSINSEEYQRVNMSQYKDSTNFTYTFTDLNSGDDVKYYIEASDSGNHTSYDPTFKELDPHHFIVK